MTVTQPVREKPAVSDLMTRAGDGDEQAWDALVARYAALVWSVCRSYRLAEADAEDVAQSVWLRLVDHLGRIREPAALPGWLATTTKRECVRVLHTTRGPRAAGPLPGFDRIPDEQAGPMEGELLAAERHAALWDAIASLPPCCQRLITLLLEDPPLPYAAISARLGISVGGIGPSRSRCLERLRRFPALAALIEAEAT